jgi:hypothetical protein
MSTDYVSNKEIPFSKIKIFNHNGVNVDVIEDGNILLTDGMNYMWVYPRAEIETYEKSADNNNLEMISNHPYEGAVFTRYGKNDPTKIIEAIENFFNVKLISEYEDSHDNNFRNRKR